MIVSKKRAAIFAKAQKVAFLYYLRSGHVPLELTKIIKAVGSDAALVAYKFNENHDPSNGQFTSGGGGDSEGDSTQVVQEEVPPAILEDAPISSGPKPSPGFQPPTNPPQLPPTEIPTGWRIREMPSTEQYPNGYWRLEKPMDNGGWQGINPSTMKPGPEPDTHIPLPLGTIG